MPNLKGSFTKELKTKNTVSVSRRRELRQEMGQFICKHRLVAGMTQEQLGEACGFSENYKIVTRWENGEKPWLTEENAQKLAEVLKLPENAFEPFMPILVKRTYSSNKDTTVGKHIMRRLKELTLPKSNLAKQLGLYPQHVDGYVAGVNEPRLLTLKKMVEVLFPKAFRTEGMMYLLYGERLPSQPYDVQIELLQQRVKTLERQLEEARAEKA